MRRSRLIIVLFSCILVVILAIASWPRRSEPEYKGKTLMQWLTINNKATDTAHDPTTLQLSYDAVQQIGTNAVRASATNALVKIAPEALKRTDSEPNQ
jgi:hypothetical protein